MINLNLTVQEVEAVLKHIEQSAVQLLDKIRMQSALQMQQMSKATSEVEAPAVEQTPPTA
jgi:hypothetical protein